MEYSMASVHWVSWVHAENYMGEGAAPAYLEEVRRDYPLSVHGVGLSLAGANGPSSRHLYRLHRLVDRFESFLVSEHLAPVWRYSPMQPRLRQDQS